MDYTTDFLDNGFAVVPAEHPEFLDELRGMIFGACKEIFEHNGDDAAAFFNNFHDLDITGTRLNELRMKVIRHCTDNIDSGSLIFKSFPGFITSLLGPDLLVQKNTNLVIQQPRDPNPSEVHRDAPVNSPYELVVWLPLVDCYGTKSMYVLDRTQSEEALSVMQAAKNDWTVFENFAYKTGKNVAVPYGHALFFWTGLIHGSHINSEKETRWSLNMRYKNLFSPNGAKEPFEFFKIFQLSPLAKIALDFQRKRLS